MRVIETQVAVIGSGPTGSAVTWRLASAGVPTVCIEAGERFDFAAAKTDAGRCTLEANPNLRRGPHDWPVDDEQSPIKPMMGNAVGGSSIYWSCHVPRFRSEDFRIHSLHGLGADWPLGDEELAPFYALNEARIGAAYLPGDPTGPERGPAGRPLPPIGALGRRMAASFEGLGWHWWPVDLARGHDAGEEACDHVGPCHVGCPARLRAGAERTYLDEAIAKGAVLASGLRVLRLEHDPRGRVTEAVCRGAEGEIRVRARAFVLAANGLGTPRLLLLSASDRFPDGLANGSGQVGRNLMLHPYARVDGLFDEPLGGFVPEETAGIVSFEFGYNRPERGFVRGLKLQVAPGPAAPALAQGAPFGEPLPWGERHHAAFEARFDRVCGITVCAEDLPEPENRIDLSPRLRDRDGLPAARMIYRVSENSRRVLDFGMARAEEALRGAGARSLHRTPLRSQSGFHLMGTARMGDDPATSVVDPDGRCHEVENLFVADASMFVTASVCNPTGTAQALALRTAERIIAHFAA